MNKSCIAPTVKQRGWVMIWECLEGKIALGCVKIKVIMQKNRLFTIEEACNSL